MTREEREKAIDLLDNLLGMIEDNQGNDYDFALKRGIEALETLEDFERAQIITGGRLNGRTYAYKRGLEDGKRKALEQMRADVENLTYYCCEVHPRTVIDDVLDVIDKYKAEMEKS
jgi:flagellar biosynthesis/type III secretory pathway protein FliH